ncbi:MAG: hypothetical protein OEM21_09190 [Nitrosopumilus sp.]|nr:hypothetical protein [Nitrosopumilus sp.]
MKTVSAKQPITALNETLRTAKTSLEKVSDETFKKWRIGRRDFP